MGEVAKTDQGNAKLEGQPQRPIDLKDLSVRLSRGQALNKVVKDQWSEDIYKFDTIDVSKFSAAQKQLLVESFSERKKLQHLQQQVHEVVGAKFGSLGSLLNMEDAHLRTSGLFTESSRRLISLGHDQTTAEFRAFYNFALQIDSMLNRQERMLLQSNSNPKLLSKTANLTASVPLAATMSLGLDRKLPKTVEGYESYLKDYQEKVIYPRIENTAKMTSMIKNADNVGQFIADMTIAGGIVLDLATQYRQVQLGSQKEIDWAPTAMMLALTAVGFGFGALTPELREAVAVRQKFFQEALASKGNVLGERVRGLVLAGRASVAEIGAALQGEAGRLVATLDEMFAKRFPGMGDVEGPGGLRFNFAQSYDAEELPRARKLAPARKAPDHVMMMAETPGEAGPAVEKGGAARGGGGSKEPPVGPGKALPSDDDGIKFEPMKAEEAPAGREGPNPKVQEVKADFQRERNRIQVERDTQDIGTQRDRRGAVTKFEEDVRGLETEWEREDRDLSLTRRKEDEKLRTDRGTKEPSAAERKTRTDADLKTQDDRHQTDLETERTRRERLEGLRRNEDAQFGTWEDDDNKRLFDRRAQDSQTRANGDSNVQTLAADGHLDPTDVVALNLHLETEEGELITGTTKSHDKVRGSTADLQTQRGRAQQQSRQTRDNRVQQLVKDNEAKVAEIKRAAQEGRRIDSEAGKNFLGSTGWQDDQNSVRVSRDGEDARTRADRGRFTADAEDACRTLEYQWDRDDRATASTRRGILEDQEIRRARTKPTPEELAARHNEDLRRTERWRDEDLQTERDRKTELDKLHRAEDRTFRTWEDDDSTTLSTRRSQDSRASGRLRSSIQTAVNDGIIAGEDVPGVRLRASEMEEGVNRATTDAHQSVRRDSQSLAERRQRGQDGELQARNQRVESLRREYESKLHDLGRTTPDVAELHRKETEATLSTLNFWQKTALGGMAAYATGKGFEIWGSIQLSNAEATGKAEFLGNQKGALSALNGTINSEEIAGVQERRSVDQARDSEVSQIHSTAQQDVIPIEQGAQQEAYTDIKVAQGLTTPIAAPWKAAQTRELVLSMLRREANNRVEARVSVTTIDGQTQTIQGLTADKLFRNGVFVIKDIDANTLEYVPAANSGAGKAQLLQQMEVFHRDALEKAAKDQAGFLNQLTPPKK